LIKVGWSTTNSPGLTFAPLVTAEARSPRCRIEANTTAPQIAAHIRLFTIPAFRERSPAIDWRHHNPKTSAPHEDHGRAFQKPDSGSAARKATRKELTLAGSVV
jgi:hypothetical protein